MPSLFWHEARSIVLMAERRNRIAPGEAIAAMGRLRRRSRMQERAVTDLFWRWLQATG
ncbi:hypothetical protein [Mesorhizobium mediterraneum]|uniref:hypothetical protein n=1 Tax=Mesorhizobium mediterraneum TaxID=43617 RepID=UPI003D7E7F3A